MIAASRCPSCGRTSVEVETPCLACNAKTERVALEPTGHVRGRTRRESDASWIVLVELEAGARLLARSPQAPEVGDAVSLISTSNGFRIKQN